jgi:hypothetical protein
MAVRTSPSALDLLDATGEPLVDPSRRVSSIGADGVPEINLGAFRGLAFALIFQTVLFLLGGLAWQIFRALR